MSIILTGGEKMSLKTLRTSKCMTQEEVAEKLGLSRSTVAMWENGESQPRAETLLKLAELFNCTIEELLKK